MNDKYHFTAEGIDAYFNKDNSDINKYVVCSCARGENDYIVEFVEHYLKLGFDKIILCDNNDIGDTSLEDILECYINDGTVEVFDCRGFGSFQVQFYSMFCIEGNYKWCAYFDCDEFLELNSYTNIKEFLDTISEDCVSFHWLMYGSNGLIHKENGGIQERFKTPVFPIQYFKENAFIKSIVRGGYGTWPCGTWFNGSHIPMSEGKTYNIGGVYTTNEFIHNRFTPTYKCGYLKHYYTKSFDEWIKKSSRGWPDGTPTLSAGNYFIFNNNNRFDLSQYDSMLFGGSYNRDEVYNGYSDLMSKFNVIEIAYPNNSNTYSTVCNLVSLMRTFSGITYVFEDERFSDNFYNMLFEIAIITGNNVCFCRDNEEIWRVVEKKHTNDKEKSYYVLEFY